MSEQINVDGADLYALREFLTRHYAATDLSFSPRMFGDHYVFTHVRGEDGDLDFQLRRAKRFDFYDLVDFEHSDGTIQVQKGELKDESDAEKVRGLVDVLGTRCYSGIIPDLDQLNE